MAKEAGEVLTKVAKIVFGVILILLGVGSYIWWGWYQDLWVLFKGGIGLVVILIGLVFILIGWSD